MYDVPSFAQIEQSILTELENQTGLIFALDSDAAIRAAGTAAAVEGLYAHQQWLGRQLFVATADEVMLPLHAQALDVPRLASTKATGGVTTVGSISGSALPLGSRLTDGQGHYWATTAAAMLVAGQPVLVPVQAEAEGAAWNVQAGATLSWVSPVAGQQSVASVVSLSGGADTESVESWRERLLAAKSLGRSQGRDADLLLAARSVAGVRSAYVFRARRGLGSVDVCVTAQGAVGADLPSTALLAAVTAAVQAVEPTTADVRAYAPDVVPLDVLATVSGYGVVLGDVEQVVRDYLGGLSPGDAYRESVLTGLILALPGVMDVRLTPSANVYPQVDWMRLEWLRADTVQAVSA